MESVLIKELIAVLIFMFCLIRSNPNFYVYILENTSELYKVLGLDFDCYDIYNTAINEHGKHYKIVLISAAARVTVIMTVFAFLLWGIIDFIISAGSDTAAAKWLMLIFITVALSAVSIIFGWIFYISCKHYKEWNIKI